ncbi:hypothetical protein LCGC14_2220410, partial [marine sediment metagenome]
MAFGLRNFCGFETGGLEEAQAVAGSPTVVNTNVRSGAYCLLMDAAADQYDMDFMALVLGGFVCFGFRTDDATPAAIRTILEIRTANDEVELSVKLNTDGKLRFTVAGNSTDYDGTTVLSDGTYHYLEVFLLAHETAGRAKLWIDNASTPEINVSSIDTKAGTALLSYCRLLGATEAFRFDDVYFGNDGGDPSPPFDPAEVFKYQSVKASATPDTGGNLNAGTWDKAGETPLAATATNPAYTSAGAGSVDTDAANGSPEGPKNDARIDGDTNIKGMKGISNMRRSGGGGSIHSILMGNDVDGTTTFPDIDPTTAFKNYFVVTESAGVVPLSTEYCSIGFQTTGAQDYECQEQWAMLLHVPSVGGDVTVPAALATATALSPVVTILTAWVVSASLATATALSPVST